MNLSSKQPVIVGRELDPRVAILSGEGAHQRVRHPEPRKGSPAIAVWERPPSLPAEAPDYYRVPLLKEPVWIWSVPLYFYVGGVAGGSALLAAAVGDRKPLSDLGYSCRWLAFLGTTIGPALLTWDLGRKLRFLNMLRVFRPTSPMSIGSWSLAGTGALATLALFLEGRSRLISLGVAGGGVLVAGYTGVLLGNTANPLWLGTRRTLPVLFTASAMASTAGILELLPLNEREEKVVERFGTIGKLAEAVAMVATERDAARNPEAAKGLREGTGGLLWRSAKILLAAGIAVKFLPVRGGWKRRVGGALTSIGAVCLRFALLESGKVAAREPRAVILGDASAFR